MGICYRNLVQQAEVASLTGDRIAQTVERRSPAARDCSRNVVKVSARSKIQRASSKARSLL